MFDTPPNPAALSPSESAPAVLPSIPAQPPVDSEIPKEPDPMLDVHPAHHAANSWRDFFVHIATIVLGLCIAVGLEQMVEHIHHRLQITETREALRQERGENHKHFAEGARHWREGVARIQNNLLVLRYLQQHPDTPQEKLPGILVWTQESSPFNYAMWDSAQQAGITSLMPREEVTREARLYKSLHTIGERGGKVWAGINAAEQYNLKDSDPTHLSPARLAEVIALTEDIQTIQYLHGIDLENLSADYHDFPPSVTFAELDLLRHRPDEQTRKLLATARTLTRERLDAAAHALIAATPDAPSEKIQTPEEK
jgi:hypothetical protein